MFVALGVEHAKRMRHIVRLYNFSPYYLTNVTILEEKVIEYKMGALNFSTARILNNGEQQRQ